MDNLTHSFVGLAAGELIHRSLPAEPDTALQSVRRRLLLISCWAASNFPDLDLFLTPLLPAPLGYLLHHRGHTHTVLYGIPQVIILWLLIQVFWPSARTLLRDSAAARKGFIGALSLGLALHLMMDFLNSYGIHPFHPFDSRWLYGDMIFIIEPYFWIAFGVTMAMMVPNVMLRGALVSMLVGAPLMFTIRGFLSWGSLAALVAVAAIVGVLQHRAGMHSRRALLAAIALSFGFIGMQAVSSMQARSFVTETLQKKAPANRVLDAAMTPYPTNPLCWTFVSVESNERAGTYSLKRGILTLAPDWLPVSECPAGFFGSLSGHATADSGIAFLSHERISLATLRFLKEGNCHFEAWLRFARAPSLSDNDASDIRYGLERKENFTTFNFADFKNRECARFIPRWAFPRADLLDPPAPSGAQ